MTDKLHEQALRNHRNKWRQQHGLPPIGNVMVPGTEKVATVTTNSDKQGESPIINVLKQEVATLKALLDTKAQELDMKTEKCDMMKKDCDSLKEHCESLEATISGLKLTNEEFDKSVSVLTKANSGLSEQVSKLTSTNQELSRICTTMESFQKQDWWDQEGKDYKTVVAFDSEDKASVNGLLALPVSEKELKKLKERMATLNGVTPETPPKPTGSASSKKDA